MRCYATWSMALALAGCAISPAQGQDNETKTPLLGPKALPQTSKEFTLDDLAEALSGAQSKHVPRSWIALPALPSGKDEFEWFKICVSMQEVEGLAALELCARRRMTPDDMTGPSGGAGGAGKWPGPKGLHDVGMACSKPDGQTGWVSRYEPPMNVRQPQCGDDCVRWQTYGDGAGHFSNYFRPTNPEAAEALSEAAGHAYDAADALKRGDQAAARRAQEAYRKKMEEAQRAIRAREIRDPWAEEEAEEPEQTEEPEQPEEPPPNTPAEAGKPGPDQQFLPPCEYGRAVQWCLSKTKGDLGYCVKFLSDGIFAVTDGKCETVILPNDQRGMMCRDKDKPAPGRFSGDSPVGPWGSAEDWCKVAKVAEPIAGEAAPTCAGVGGGPDIKFLDTTHLQKILDELCTGSGAGLCPEDFR